MSSPCCACLACIYVQMAGRSCLMALILWDLLHGMALRSQFLSVGWRLLGLVRQEMVRAELICVGMHEQLCLMTPLHSCSPAQV